MKAHHKDLELDQEIMARESPEGRPAHPEFGARVIMILLGVGSFGLLVTAFLLGLFVSPFAAVCTAAIAVLLILANPVFWASLSRARERKQLQHQ